MQIRRPALILLGLLALTTFAPAEDSSPYEERLKPGHCPCANGQACWHYLRTTMKPPEDACRCGCCLAGGDCSTRDRPPGTRPLCWQSRKEECFWKRHASSWQIRCSECWADTECDVCDEGIGGRDAQVLGKLEELKVIEGGEARDHLYIAVSPHFYVVTDIHRRLKVRTQGGAPRKISGHEFVHLFAQRCEQAYEDFKYWFGPGVSLGKPMAVYLFAKNSEKENTANRYLGSPRTNMLYGGGSDRIAGGFSGNGFVGSLQDLGDDRAMHAYCRHMVGHILLSCWHGVNPHEENLPKWAFIGAAHFLEKLLPEHEDEASFCSNETRAPTGSPKDWGKRAAALARRRLDPIETYFNRDSMGAMSYEDHIRAWSYMDLMLREDRDRWLKALALLRRGEDEGVAFREALEMSPDDFHSRWVDRLSGKRDTMGHVRKDDREEDEDPTARERRRVESEQDPDVLAGLIRGLDKLTDVRMAKSVISRLDHDSDLVRETIHLVLSNTRDEDVLAFLLAELVENRDARVRAGIARAFGQMKHAPAREALEDLLEDRNWLARAEAGWALGRIGDEASLPALVGALDDKQPKAWILIADAVASYGRPSEEATLQMVEHLDHSDWQMRVAACRALARVGTESALDGLIARFNLEGGRLYRELHAALKAVSQDDLGPNPDTWRRWWEEKKKEHGGLGPQPEIRNPADDRYGTPPPPGEDDPHYYGHRIFSKSVGFVLDTSGSMDKTMQIPEDAAKQLGLPMFGTRFDLAKGVLIDALEKLDPRVRFSLVFFSTEVRPWKDRLVPAGSSAGSAAGAVRAQPAEGETNIHGALKAALGLHEKGSLEASLDPIPDTVYFLTDGSPTRGEITAADALLSWFRNLNRYALVELNVIALGNLGVDIPFLQRLADAGGGTFTHVPER